MKNKLKTLSKKIARSVALRTKIEVQYIILAKYVFYSGIAFGFIFYFYIHVTIDFIKAIRRIK